MYLNEDILKYNVKKEKEIRKQVNNIFDLDEVNQLTLLSSSYMNIFKSKNDILNKLNRLYDTLLLANSYYERLVSIRNDLVVVKNKINKVINYSYRLFYHHKSFLKLQKKNQENVIDAELGNLYDLYDSIVAKMEIVDTNIKYLNDTQFNIKSCIGSLKNSEQNNVG